METVVLKRNRYGRRKPGSVRGLEELGRVRLSRNFFLRDFLFSEIAVMYGLRNVPDDPDLAIEVGSKLCEELLEPIQSKFGRVAIRSAYRSCAVNALGNQLGLSCASNERNYARHIWDRRARDGSIGAMACIVVPWLVDHLAKGGEWREMAWWIHRHLPYSELQFFPRLTAFNIGWRERPQRRIYSFIRPRGLLTLQKTPNKRSEHHGPAGTRAASIEAPDRPFSGAGQSGQTDFCDTPAESTIWVRRA